MGFYYYYSYILVCYLFLCGVAVAWVERWLSKILPRKVVLLK